MHLIEIFMYVYVCTKCPHRLVLDSALLIQKKATPQARIKLQTTYMSMCMCFDIIY